MAFFFSDLGFWEGWLESFAFRQLGFPVWVGRVNIFAKKKIRKFLQTRELSRFWNIQRGDT